MNEYNLNEDDINKKISKKDLDRGEFSTAEITKNNSLYTVLIVEDDPATRKIIIGQLSAAKYNIVSVKNGIEALEAIKTNLDIDIVLLDLILPDISGYEVCKEIRLDFTMYEKPVIMITSKNYLKDLVEGFKVGANDFITKPYNIYELITRINSSISLKKMFEDNTSLKEINQIKSDIVDMAAHDLKSPLTIISGYAKRILKLVTPNSKESKNSQKILDSSNKMLSIIDKLLDDSKYDSKRVRLEKTNINQILIQVIDFHLDLAEDKKQKLNYLSYNDEVILNLDKNSIVTIFDNLLNNAIKYSPIDSEIDIELTESDKSVAVSIKDRGNGFTKDEIENLFTKYFPYTNKPTKGEDSTGLGLYIVNDMVKRNKGSISVESTRGVGSKFIVSFLKD